MTSTTEENVISVTGLSKSFGDRRAVVDVSLSIRKGEIFGFIGPNGSGKTTTIRMLCGLITPDSGEGTCLGYNIRTQSAAIKRLVGYVPQAFSLYQDLTVKENLSFMASVYGKSIHDASTQTMIADLGLTTYLNHLAGKLSGGWKQRLSLAAALLHDPKLLLLDEPTAGVDPSARRDFWNDIFYLTTKGISALLTTHYMDEAERCNRLAYIFDGRLLATGTIPEVIESVGLTSYAVSGKNLGELAHTLSGHENIQQVVALGNELRVSSAHREAIAQVVATYPQYQWRPVDTNLEEVFIHLVNHQE